MQNPVPSILQGFFGSILKSAQMTTEGYLKVALASDPAGALAVTMADGANVTQGTEADAAWSGSGNGTLVAILKAIYAKVAGTLGIKAAGLKYVTCAAGGTQALGTGAAGDTINTLIIVPGTAAAGTVGIKDGAGSTISVFAGGGTTALTDLRPQTVTLNAISTAGGWSVVNGANVTCIAVGQFTP